MREAVPDLDRLLAGVRAIATRPGSYLHGEPHWRGVALAGLRLAAEVERADPAVVFLFALFHDSQRLSEGDDSGHGERAAAAAERLAGGLHRLSGGRLALLREACRDHADGTTSDRPTIAVCWDADRLNLWRIGVRPDLLRLSSEAARRPEVIEAARSYHDPRESWHELFAAFASAPRPRW